MEFIQKDNGNLEYEDENGVYTFVNMGAYVGYASREWWAVPSEYWKLMFYESKDDNQPIKIETLIDSSRGDYIRIMVTLKDMKRVLMLKYGLVDTDTVYHEKEGNPVPDKSYCAFSDRYQEKVHPELAEYLGQSHRFVSEDNGREEYVGEVASDTHIINFLNSGKSLLEALKAAQEQQKNSDEGKTY